MLESALSFRLDSENFFILAIGFVNLALAYFIFKKGRGRQANVSFSVFTLGIAFWAFGMFMYRGTSSHLSVVWYARLLYFASGIIPLAFLHFSLIFPYDELKMSRWKKWLIFFPPVILVFSSFVPGFIVENITIRRGAENEMFFGNGYMLWSFYLVTYFIWSFFNLVVTYKNHSDKVRLQVRYIIIGGLLTLIFGTITNLILPAFGNTEFGWLGQPSSMFLIVFVAYSITRHRLLGIRVIISKLYFYLTLTMFFLIASYTASYIEIYHLKGIFQPVSVFLSFVVAILVAVAILPILNYIQRSSDIIFYKGHNPRTVIKELSLKLNSVIDLKHLVRIVMEEFHRVLLVEDVRLIFSSESQYENGQEAKLKKGYVPMMICDKNGINRTALSKKNVFFREITRRKVVIVRDEIFAQEGNTTLVRAMDKAKIFVLAPLKVHSRIIGSIVLGEKIDQDAFTKEDIEFLEIISNQVAVAIENARMYTEISEFNVYLQKEVKRATAELAQANNKLQKLNVKLKKLDRAKSEFLSIASHQLRTPITSIKGFVSLILEGSYGRVPKKIREVLEKIFLSNERMIGLIEDLLNLSRIESGRMVFDFAKTSVTQMVTEVVDPLRLGAKAKGLELIYKSPRKKHEVVMDVRKVREVVSNLTDNAIKYTQQGFVKVEILDKKDAVQVVVSDSGRGIAPDEVDYIFEKFQRGQEVQQVHTEGVGLGLYVCRKIVEMHKGKIWAESDGEGKGSRFIVEFDKKFNPPKTTATAEEKK